jgi:pyridoxal phosphate-dependent aminotransferase EpsN
MSKRIYLSPPHMEQLEKDYLNQAFDSNWIAPLGPFVEIFENEMAKYIGVKSAAALSSGTAALHLALLVLGVGEGDKVACSSLTFAASANAINYVNAVPIFIDSDPRTWNLDLNLLEHVFKEHRPKALIAVDIYGQSCDYDRIIELGDKYGVKIIEDSAESLGSKYKGKKCGSFGDIAILSFNGNKIITTSGGGMLLSNNEEYVEKARFLATQAREASLHYEHKEIGYNYRLSNLLAAVGSGQLQQLDKRVDARRRIYEYYFDRLSHLEGIVFNPEEDFGIGNRWLTALTIDSEKAGVNRSQIIEALEKENIESRPVWKPMHLQPAYSTSKYYSSTNDDVARRLFETGLCLPSGSSLHISQQERVIEIVDNICSSSN